MSACSEFTGKAAEDIFTVFDTQFWPVGLLVMHWPRST